MSKYLIKNYPIYYELFLKKLLLGTNKSIEPIKQRNRNPLLYKNVGVDGVKTGYLAVEKYSLASSMKNEKRMIAVVSGFETKKLEAQVFKTFNWGLNTNTLFQKDKTFELDVVGTKK